MKAARLHGAEDLRVEHVEKPTINHDEFLIRVKAATICATDVRIYTYGDPRVKYPRILGHEFAGDVEEVGARLEGYLNVGMRVTVNPNMYCGRCRYCVAGRHELCESRYALGIDVDGAFAEYLKVPSEAFRTGGVCEVPPNISYEEAALVEPLSACLHGQEFTQTRAGDIVAIIGAGPIGLMHAMISKAMGASKVIISEVDDNRLKEAANFGADYLINPLKEDLPSRINQITDGHGADVVIVAVGSPAAQQQALSIAAKGGRVNFFGGLPAGRDSVPLSTNLIHYKEIFVLGTSSQSIYDFRKTLDLVSAGVLNVKRFVTHRFPLDKAVEALKVASSRAGLKVCISP
ncbi:MAG: zinc-dependent dehydrogenase [Nitrososphaerota archaeon]|nr:zinc-dependent dehydrogenase [Candidatus Bathyarchaeota archaeon]MDW8022895.1 zinc-dependent dehydrogenase [Nitrososphaerota archaeon]